VLAPDEKYLIQGQHITAKDGESLSGDILQIWNIEKKKHILVGRQRAGSNLATTFSPDSQYVIACGSTGIIRVRVGDENVEVIPLEEPKHISGDGSLVACLTNEGWQVRSVDTQSKVLELPENVDRFLAFSPNNQYVATTIKKENTPEGGSTVGVWPLQEQENNETLTPSCEISVPSHFPSAERTRFSPNGRLLALPSRQGGYVGVWDVQNGKMYKELGVHDGSIRTLEFSRDGKLLAVGTQEAGGKYGKVYVWDVISGTKNEFDDKQAKGVTALCFTSDNETIFFGNSSGDIKQVNIKVNNSMFSFMSR
jgi:WD40 repeat protein